MIPKIIHWCWLSDNSVPESLQKCMDSWKIHLPDYEFVHWNFERFPKGTSKWVDDAYENKKYAFAADYIRLYALYHYGGFYLDMDVEVIKSFNPFLNLRTVLCYQNEPEKNLEVAAFGVQKGELWVKKCLDELDNSDFIEILDSGEKRFNQEILPHRVKRVLIEHDFSLEPVMNINEAIRTEIIGAIPVFPFAYFSPKSYDTGKICLSQDTVCIHHFEGSWLSHKKKIESAILRLIRNNYRLYSICSKIKRKFTHSSAPASTRGK